MSSLFRSQEMALCQLFLQPEAAYACVSELGELGLVQFRDLNQNVSAFQRKFVSEVRRCEEMERKLRYVEKEMKKDGIKITETGDNPKAPFPREMVDLEAAFEKLETELREVNTNAEALQRNFLELSELREVLKKTQTFFAVHEEDHIYQTLVEDPQHSLATAEAPTAQTSVMQLGFVAGVISRERMSAFERILWFACRGNVFLKTEEIAQPLEDPHSGNEMHKCVFLIFFQGEQLKARVRKICDGYRATLYPCPESAQERQEMLNGVTVRLEDLRHVLEQTKEHRTRVLKKSSTEIYHWILKARKIKAIYHMLNMANFDMSHNSLIAECWCPVNSLDAIKMGLLQGTEASGSTVAPILHRMETDEDPPTYQATNIFTKGFQNIVDAYGVANYREVNPALYAIITFPFLFAVMFGDAGHGFIMFLFGLWMIIKEKGFLAAKSDNEIWNTFFGGRYIILLMGLFSIYTGLLYNDVFSKSVNIFGTKWHPNYTYTIYETTDILQMDPEFDFQTQEPYPFGIDPVWQLSTNKITFLNSFKMKVAVILGISQMLFGVVMSLANQIHFRKYLDIFCEFIPSMIFLLAIFGYLVATIFYKWITYDVSLSQEAPSLLIHLINMFLMKYDNSTLTPMSQRPYYEDQQTAQTVLVALAGICIPWLLLPKPFVLKFLHGREQKGSGLSQSRDLLVNSEVHPEDSATSGSRYAKLSEEQTVVVKAGSSIEMAAVVNEVSITVTDEDPTQTGEEAGMPNGKKMPKPKETHKEEFEFGEVFIHQCIHTIEYCLGCISNTASYLRLWALSLAHSQLSDVLWNMVLKLGLGLDGYLGVVGVTALFAFWAVLTVAVLLLMEGLSAFLHALRLHWVEFQNKFYQGAGYAFLPFNFKNIMDQAATSDKLE